MDKDTLDIVITGHVDHGKSTLIGRILFDTGSIPEDRLAAIKAASGIGAKDLDLAFLTDQLEEERGKLMTLDTSQVRFSTASRDYVFIDSPGHVEFTKNMMTGASHADLGILVVSAVDGPQEQTKRHAYILNMLGMKTLTVLINKMDLSAYSEDRFNHAVRETEDFLRRIGTKMLYAIPVSAIKGDNITKHSKNMSWYKGPTLLSCLDKFKGGDPSIGRPLRFPVQDVYPVDAEKVFAGRVESGTIRKGDDVSVSPSGERSTVKDIKVFGPSSAAAAEGENIGITLSEDRGVFVGSVLSALACPALPRKSFTADVFWLAESPMRVGERFTFRCVSQETECVIEKIEQRMDPSTLDTLEERVLSVGPNEIGRVKIVCSESLVVEDFAFIPGLGRFVLENGTGVRGAGIVRL
jgi:small GTP-binding protein